MRAFFAISMAGLEEAAGALPHDPRSIAESPELNPVENIGQFRRDNRLSNRIFNSSGDILDHCCFASNKLIHMPWKIVAVGTREWAYRSQLPRLGIRRRNASPFSFLTESNLIAASLWQQRIKPSLIEGYARSLLLEPEFAT
jgi:hypothetical protein